MKKHFNNMLKLIKTYKFDHLLAILSDEIEGDTTSK